MDGRGALGESIAEEGLRDPARQLFASLQGTETHQMDDVARSKPAALW
jgi:hypothetical protein